VNNRTSIDLSLVDPDDLDNNTVDTPHLNDLLALRLHRRHVLKGGVGAMAVAAFGPPALASTGSYAGSLPSARAATSLDFTAIAKSLADEVKIADGYTATVIYATGDSIDPFVPDYVGDGSEANFARRAGDHHDGIHYFGLGPTGRRQESATNRALLALNHENISGTQIFLHPNGPTNPTGARPAAEAIKEIEAHGVSVIEISKGKGKNGKFEVQKGSRFNRRVTASTIMSIAGPVRGTKWVKTKFSTEGLMTRGTLNNCGHGYTPWGTYLTAEENWAGYLRRDTGDDAKRVALYGQRDVNALKRNGMTENRAGNYRWAYATPEGNMNPTEFSRWNTSVIDNQPADGTGDFRNVHNTFGYIVEIDPYNPQAIPKKRTALGRRANEGAWGSLPKKGKPLAFYIGCDSRGEYVYKFVTAKTWNPEDGNRGGLAVGDKYLDQGTIYAARFDADGTGVWEKLDLSNPKVAAGVADSTLNPGGYKFENLADICVNTRLAAGAAGATRMDRPEWTAVNPTNGEIYITMTENPDRGNSGTTSNNIPNPEVDASNPRAWLDLRTDSATKQRGNVHGHIVRIREDGDDAGATTFRWDIFLFGAQAKADAGVDDVNYQQNVNISGLTDWNDLSKPDGCWFSSKTGILWIETDDNTLTDQSNAMLLAAIPGSYGDGGPVVVNNLLNGDPEQGRTPPVGSDTTVTTYAGRKMTDATFKRFMVAPKGAEITGVTESPDGRVMFINIQHPGENTAAGNIGDPTKFESHWPGNGGGVAAYGPGGATARPRSATVMITRNDGGLIGADLGERSKDRD
jgi:secreted PhoX family phosphatase